MSTATRRANDPVVPVELYGAPVGLYTGKIRSYLRKQGIAYVERLPTDRAFRKEILPIIGRFMNPVVRTAGGQVVQDTTDIIDWFERSGLARTSAYPASPRQKLVALALDLLGGEGLVRPAMHYRWSFPDHNRDFLRYEFGLAYRAIGMAPEQIEQQLDLFTGYLAEYLPQLGITQATAAAIEEAYTDLLAALEAHLREHPYLLGGRPTCADYGMFATLWAHLGRDPYPAAKMKREAPAVARWCERMHAADDDVPEFPRTAPELAADDAIPATLAPVLALMARDYLPELEAAVAATDAWLAAHPDVERGDLATPAPAIRWNHDATFRLRDAEVTTTVPVYMLYMLQRVTDAYAALAEDARAAVWRTFADVGLERLLTLKAARRIERQGHLETWGERS